MTVTRLYNMTKHWMFSRSQPSQSFSNIDAFESYRAQFQGLQMIHKRHRYNMLITEQKRVLFTPPFDRVC